MAINPDLNLKSHGDPAKDRQRRSWGGFAGERVALDDAVEYVRKGESYFVALHDIVLVDGEIRGDDGTVSTRKDLRRTLTIAPPDYEIRGWSLPSPRRNEFTALYFDPDEIESEVGARYAKNTPSPAIYVQDARIAGALTRLGDLLVGDDDRLLAETLCILVALDALDVMPDRRAGALSAKQLDRAIEFLTSNRSSDLGLSDMAAAVGLSRYHFLRAFKQSTGLSPYRYLQLERLARARELMLDPGLSVADVARQSGFSSVKAMHRVFQQELHATPSEFRRSST